MKQHKLRRLTLLIIPFVVVAFAFAFIFYVIDEGLREKRRHD